MCSCERKPTPIIPMRTFSFFTEEKALIELFSVSAAPVSAVDLIKFLRLKAKGISNQFYVLEMFCMGQTVLNRHDPYIKIIFASKVFLTYL